MATTDYFFNLGTTMSPTVKRCSEIVGANLTPLHAQAQFAAGLPIPGAHTALLQLMSAYVGFVICT